MGFFLRMLADRTTRAELRSKAIGARISFDLVFFSNPVTLFTHENAGTTETHEADKSAALCLINQQV